MNCRAEDAVWPEPEWNADRNTFLGQCPRCATPPMVVFADTPEGLQEAYADHDQQWHPTLPDRDLRGHELLQALLDPSTAEGTWAKWAVRDYWWTFTGAAFDSLGHTADKNDPDPEHVTATDIVAVSMLDVHVPGAAARMLLGPSQQDVHRHLALVPSAPMYEVEREVVEPGSEASKLWHLLRDSRMGMGPTITSKLLARKRPHLLPVYDTRVAYRLGWTDTTNDWLWWWDWWDTDASRVAAARDLRSAAGSWHEGRACRDASLLRILDVAVWRYDKHFRPKLRHPAAA